MNLDTYPKRVLITGASGLLGATLLDLLKTRYDLYGTYLNHPIKLDGTKTFKLDLTDTNSMLSALNDIKPEIIIHTAALVDVDACEKNKQFAYRLNFQATESLARVAEKNNIFFVYISTDAFFSDTKKDYFSESDEPNPVNYYGETKLLAENAVRSICHKNLIVRTNIYGWNYQNKYSLAEWMLAGFRQGMALPLVHDVYYTPILTDILAETIDKLLVIGATGTFNVASDKRISKLEFGKLLCNAFGISKDLIIPKSINDISLFAKRSNNMALNVFKLKSTLPTLDLSVESHLHIFGSKTAKQLLLKG